MIARYLRSSNPEDAMAALERRRAEDGENALDELEQQRQVAVSGTATTVLAWSTVDLDFAVYFVDATEQRDSSLTRPHFTFGAVVVDSEDPVALTATVRAWVVDERGSITGATVAIGCQSASSVEFTGYVDLTFQGYGATRDEDIDA